MTSGRTSSNLAWPLAVWLAVQMAAMGVGTMGLRLAAGHDEPREWVTLDLLLVVQIGVGAMGFPFLMRDWRSSAMVVATAVPFAQLAAYVSAYPMDRWMPAVGIVVIWLVTLAIARGALSTWRGQLVGVALASAVAIGGAILAYLRVEFSAGPALSGWRELGVWGPMIGALAQLHHGEFHVGPWISGGLMMILVAVGAMMARRRRARASSSTSYAQPTTVSGG